MAKRQLGGAEAGGERDPPNLLMSAQAMIDCSSTTRESMRDGGWSMSVAGWGVGFKYCSASRVHESGKKWAYLL